MVDKLPEGYVALDDLQVWQENYNQGDVGAIYAGILKFGFNNAPRVWRDNQVRGGNHSVLALRMVRANHNPVPKNVLEKDGQWYIRTVDVSHLSESEALAYAISDNRLAARASQDEDLLIHYLRQSEDEGLLKVTGYDTEDVARMLAAQLYDDAPDKTEAYDATKLNGAAAGTAEIACLIYVAFPTREDLDRALKALTFGERSTAGDVHARMAALDGQAYLERWEAVCQS